MSKCARYGFSTALDTLEPGQRENEVCQHGITDHALHRSTKQAQATKALDAYQRCHREVLYQYSS